MNDAGKNDMLEKVEDNTMEGLKALGAFGLQVPQDNGNIIYCLLQYVYYVMLEPCISTFISPTNKG